MSYLRNKQQQRKKITAGVSAAAVVLLILVFKSPVLKGFESAAHAIFRPFISLKIAIGNGASSFGANFNSKKSLMSENEDLKNQLEEVKISAIDRGILLDENFKLKEILNRKSPAANLTLATILLKPNQSPYDTLIVDIGDDAGIKKGDRVFAYGNILIGSVSDVYGSSSNVKLYSTPGETLSLIVGGKDIYTDAVGRGGGNFEITLPQGVDVPEGTELSIPGIIPKIVAIVEQVISDPRNPFQKILARSPVNVQELKFVEIEK